jgi:DedD protein
VAIEPPAATAVAKSAATAPTASAPDAANASRFVVQVGAYADAGKLRDARSKVEQLGLKTYTQVVESESGSRTRVRVGPFSSRPEADAAAAKLKRAGLPTAVLTL